MHSYTQKTLFFLSVSYTVLEARLNEGSFAPYGGFWLPLKYQVLGFEYF